MKVLFAIFAVCIFSTAHAAVVHPFGTPKFTTTGGTGYTTSMAIAGSITTVNPLPANMPLTDIGPAGSNLVSSWTLGDGVTTFTNANSGPYGGVSGNFRVATNAIGRITAFSIKLMSPSASNVLVGMMASVLTLSSLPELRGEIGAFCLTASGGMCRSLTDGLHFGAVSTSSGIIDVDGNGRFDALTDGLMTLRFLLGLRGASLIQGAVGSGATRTTAAEIEAWLSTFASP